MGSRPLGEVKSYAVERKAGKLIIAPQRWEPGYTEAHKATPEAALDFAIARWERELTRLQADLDFLKELRYGK